MPNLAWPGSPNWLTGKTFREQLSEHLNVNWSGRQLRDALESLSKARRVAIVLDRRIDPGQSVELSLTDTSLESVLQTLASQQHLGLSIFEPVVYLGPPETSDQLRTLSALRKEEASHLPAAIRAGYTRLRPWHWDDLATPKELLGGLASECGIPIAGVEEIPHDLWAKADLPPLSFVDRLTLVAAQFDRTFAIEPDGKSVRLAPLPKQVTLHRSYSPDSMTADILASQLSKVAPRAKVETAGGKLAVDARVEDHDLIEAMMMKRDTKRPAASEGKKVHTLTVKNVPVGRLLSELGRQMGLDIRLNEPKIKEAGLSLDTLVSIDVKNVTSDELLRAACDPAGLTFSRSDKIVEIQPAKR